MSSTTNQAVPPMDVKVQTDSKHAFDTLQVQHLTSKHRHAVRARSKPDLRVQTRHSYLMSAVVDPALLCAKLEVARLEQDAVKKPRDHRHRSSSSNNDRRHGSVREKRSSSQRRQRDSLRNSLPIEPEWTADGKPVFNTAQILAALDVKTLGRESSLTRSHGHSLDVGRDNRHSGDHSRSDSKRDSADKEVLEAKIVAPVTTNAGRRRFAHAPGTVQLIPVKHGSQTAYERIEIPDAELLEDSQTEEQDGQRPKLSKYDRPHWAQQSQNAHEMSLLKQSLNGLKQKKPRPKSYVPALAEESTVVVRRSSVGAKHNEVSGTLIADAVSQIKKEERLRKWQSVQNFLKLSCA